MKLQKAFRNLLSLYVWSFILYQILPFEIIPYVNYAPRELYPKPISYRYTFAYDVKTAFSNHVGSIKNLLNAMEREGFDISFGDVPQEIGDKIFPKPKDIDCEVIRTSEIGVVEKILHSLLEELPKTLVGEKGDRLLARRSFEGSKRCWLLAHDERILFSTFWGFELPSYRTVLSRGKNLFLSREVLFRKSYTKDFLRGSTVLLDDSGLRIFAYSEKSFYFPGERTKNPFRLVVEADLRNPLIILYRNGKRTSIYAQDRLNINVNEPGSYSVTVMTYKLKVHVFFLGLRTVALSSPVELIK